MKISKQSMKDMTDLAAAVHTKQAEAEAAIEAYNEALELLRNAVEAERDQQQSEFDDKSETWQQGERGQAAEEWIGTIDNALSGLDEVAAPDFADISEVEGLSSAPEA